MNARHFVRDRWHLADVQRQLLPIEGALPRSERGSE
jgi:hypothetical protein